MSAGSPRAASAHESEQPGPEIEHPRWLRILAVPAMVIAGGCVALQSEVNGNLAERLGTGPRAGLLAALLSFAIGLAIMVVAMLVIPAGRRGIGELTQVVRTGRLRPVYLIGGLFGAYLVATQGLTVGIIGVALFSVSLTAGQSTAGLLVDHIGLGPSGPRPLERARFVAASFAVIAVLLAASERAASQLSATVLIVAILPFLAGAGSAVQQALNGRVAQAAGTWPTTLNNFAVGTAALAVAFPVTLLWPGQLQLWPQPWWLYLGGPIGIAFIALAAVLVKVHGVLVLGLSMVAGQVITAEFIELLAPDPQIGILGVIAGLLTVAGVVIALVVRPQSGGTTE